MCYICAIKVKVMKINIIASLFLSLSMLTSCVSKKKYAEMTANYDKCTEDLKKTDLQNGQLAVRVDGLERELNNANKQMDVLQKSLDACLQNANQGSTNITKLLEEIDKSNVYIKKLVESKFKNDSLNLYISNSLKRSLDNLNDEDVDIEVQKGVVFISLSDKMLYKSGSYEILPTAETVLAKVAKIVNDYNDYDVLVEGHTDNDPYKGTGVIKDNWDLSALRATAVVRMLQDKFNVAPSRMTAGGRSEFVPVASNNTVDGKSKNRRTVIIVLPKLDQFLKLMNDAPVKK